MTETEIELTRARRGQRLGTTPGQDHRRRARAIDPGLLLFAAFVAHRLAVNAGSSAGSTAAVAATAG